MSDNIGSWVTAEDGRVALVTGGSRGIGLAVATCLAEAGQRLCVVRSGLEPPVEDLTAKLTGHGAPDTSVVRYDVGQPESAGECVASVLDAWGRLDVLVNVAGRTGRTPLFEVTPAQLEEQFRVNAFAPFWFSQAAARHMVAQGGGRIVTVTSIAAEYSLPGRALYEASKAAANRFTRALARELAPSNIQVNAVAPGLVATETTKMSLGEEFDRRAQALPAGRAATSAEIAEVVCYLATEAPAFLTGEVVTVDGARMA